MKRTMVALGLITLFILTVVLLDFWFMTGFAKEMNNQLDRVEAAESFEEKKEFALKMDEYYSKRSFIAHRLVPTDRLDELKALLHKLNAYIQTKEEHEVLATTAEIRSKVNSMYSTAFYLWYHPEEFCIE